MFNPKGNTLLDDQLAVSGLHLNAAVGATMAVASFGLNLVSGIMGSSSAKSQNSFNRKQYKKQRKFNKKIAKKTNEYNKLADANTQANYFAMRDFNRNASLSNWERGKEIQDYKFDSVFKQFEKSQSIGNAQLGLNKQDAKLAKESEKLSLKDAFLQKQFSINDSKIALKDELTRLSLESIGNQLGFEQSRSDAAFNRQEQQFKLKQAGAVAGLDRKQQASRLAQTYDEANLNRKDQYTKLQGIRSRRMTGNASIENTIDQLMTQGNFAKEASIVEGLVAEGKVSLGQAGKSTAKARQSSKANLQRSIMRLSSELSGKRKQAGIQLAELNAELSLAETGIGINLQRIDTNVKGVERDVAINMDRINTNLQGLQAETSINLQRINSAEMFAGKNLALQTKSITNALEISERDYKQNLEIIDANYNSAKGQTELNIRNIGFQKKYANLNTKASMMLRPEKLSYDPMPQEPPEHIFLESMKSIKSFTPSPTMQNIYAPIISGAASGLGALAQPDWSQLGNG